MELESIKLMNWAKALMIEYKLYGYFRESKHDTLDCKIKKINLSLRPVVE